MIRKPYALLLLIAGLFTSKSSISQQTETPATPFSEWTLRVNPFSFFERLGGVHIGVETNIDAKKKFFFVSEYGYIFINNQHNTSSNEGKNPNKLSGFETKQEVKMALNTGHGRITSMLGLEVNLQRASLKNAGWFGMGDKDVSGLYPYFKYQDFKEQVTEKSAAIKYILKSYPFKKNDHHLEFFGGLGLLHRDVLIKGAEGVLHQPDASLLYDDTDYGYKLYLAAGCRLMVRIK